MKGREAPREEMASHPPCQVALDSKGIQSLKVSSQDPYPDAKQLLAGQLLDAARANCRPRD